MNYFKKYPDAETTLASRQLEPHEYLSLNFPIRMIMLFGPLIMSIVMIVYFWGGFWSDSFSIMLAMLFVIAVPSMGSHVLEMKLKDKKFFEVVQNKPGQYTPAEDPKPVIPAVLKEEVVNDDVNYPLKPEDTRLQIIKEEIEAEKKEAAEDIEKKDEDE